jgi:hypothetical protein
MDRRASAPPIRIDLFRNAATERTEAIDARAQPFASLESRGKAPLNALPRTRRGSERRPHSLEHMESKMKVLPTLVLGGALAFSITAGSAEEFDWQKVDATLGRKPAVVVADVRRYGFPRSDLEVTVDGVAIKPALALGGWIAFKPAKDKAMAMGDLVLLESEVNPVIAKLTAAGFEITGVHNHLLRAKPTVMYVHIAAHGDPVELAARVRDALTVSKTPPSAGPAAASPAIDLDMAQLERQGHPRRPRQDRTRQELMKARS